MNFSLKQLRIFIEVAKHNSVSIAAKQLNLSQPATSMAISELERLCNDKLFDRQNKRLFLNEKGRRLFPQALETIERLQELNNNFFVEDIQLSGTCHLGASSTIGNYIMPNHLASFTKKFPTIDLKIAISNSQSIIDKLLNFQIDLGLIEGTCQHKDIESIPWQNDELVIFCSKNHPLAKKSSISLNDLSKAKWILREVGAGTKEVFEQAIAGKLNNLNVLLELGNSEAIKSTVASNLGISCLSLKTIEKLVQSKDLVILNTPFLSLKRKLYLLIHKKKYRNYIFLQCLDFWQKIVNK